MTSRGITAGLFRTRKVLSVTERLLWWGCRDSDKRDLKGVSVLCDTNNIYNIIKYSIPTFQRSFCSTFEFVSDLCL